MTESLKNCPFCCCVAIVEKIGGIKPDLYQVACIGCMAYVGNYINKQDAINNWNKRVGVNDERKNY